MAGSFGDWFGTLKNVFKIGKGSLDTSAMTAARTLTFRDLSGTVALTSDGGAVYSESAQTVTGSPQTVFTVPSYTPGSKTLAVYRNGLRLTLTSDYTETNSTTVTLTSAAAVGDDMLFTIGAPTGSFGTMATQNANAVAITGGTATLSSEIISANSSSTALRITQEGTGDALLVEDSANPDATPFVITSSGSIGIGTSSPSVKLDLVDPTSCSVGVKQTSGTPTSALFFASSSGFSGVGTQDATAFLFRTNGLERTRIVSAGRVLIGTPTDNGADQLQVSGHIATVTAGNGYKTKEGTNAKQGTATLTAGAVTVSNTSVTANSRIFLTSQADGGTPGFLRVSARTAGTSFTITSSSGTDTSTVAYEIFEPA